MRFLKSELRSLFPAQNTPAPATQVAASHTTVEPPAPPEAPADDCIASRPSSPAAASRATAAGDDQAAHAPFAPNLVAVLRSAAPRLWARAISEQATRRLQRERLVELLAWLLSKNGYEQLRPARQDYFEHGRVIEGRLALLAQRGGERLAIEICLDPTLSCAYKLLAARKAGAQAVMLCGFADSTAQAHEAMGRLAGRSTDHWFTAVCLAPKSKGPR
ncbi:hypothetical protein D3C71_21650 [compost metagenome]